MSATVTPSGPVATDSVAVQTVSGAPGRLRRLAIWVLVVLVGVVTLAVISANTPPPPTALDPDSTRPEGAHAVAAVLQRQGVAVDVVRSIGDLEDEPTRGATVVISAMGSMTSQTIERAMTATTNADRLVLIAPNAAQTRATGLPIQWRVTYQPNPQSADCTTDFVRPTERVGGFTATYSTQNSAWSGCFGSGDRHGLVTGPGADGVDVVVVGQRDFLSNSAILSSDAAALAVRLLGHSDRLVWYHSGPVDLAERAAEEEGGFQMPVWFSPLVVLLASTVLLLALIFGRRLGRVVREPLPVIVRAVETTHARGVLYRRADDPVASAQALRAGTRRRLAARFGVRREDGDKALVSAVANATGLPAAHIGTLLHEPISETLDLVDFAQALRDLEEKVRHP